MRFLNTISEKFFKNSTKHKGGMFLRMSDVIFHSSVDEKKELSRVIFCFLTKLKSPIRPSAKLLYLSLHFLCTSLASSTTVLHPISLESPMLIPVQKFTRDIHLRRKLISSTFSSFVKLQSYSFMVFDLAYELTK